MLLKKMGLADSIQDAFANGFMLGCLSMIILFVCTIAMVIDLFADKALIP